MVFREIREEGEDDEEDEESGECSEALLFDDKRLLELLFLLPFQA